MSNPLASQPDGAYRRRRLSPGILLLVLPLLFFSVACGGDRGVNWEQLDANFPVALAFAPDGRLYYGELFTGDVRIVTPDGTLLEDPFAHVDVAKFLFWGLLGLTLDPDFEKNHYVYVYFIRLEGSRATVMRFTDVDNKGTEPTIILDDLPLVHIFDPSPHVGGTLRFGPDGYLYLTLGDFTSPNSSYYFNPPDPQDLSVLPGKILRVNKEDGSPPPDNPFVNEPGADPRIFAHGFRNSFDFTFHPRTGEMYATENAAAICDELNIVTGGGDYGWPLRYEPESCRVTEGVQPIFNFAIEGKQPWEPGSPTAPTGIEFVSADVYPSLGDSLLVCGYHSRLMSHLRLEGPDQDQVIDEGIVVSDCELDVVQDPQGVIYYSNSEEIRRLAPQ